MTCIYYSFFPAQIEFYCPDQSADVSDYGSVMVTNYTVDGMAKYTCNEGFKLVGETDSDCEDDGEWSNIPPKCQRTYYNYFAIILHILCIY